MGVPRLLLLSSLSPLRPSLRNLCCTYSSCWYIGTRSGKTVALVPYERSALTLRARRARVGAVTAHRAMLRSHSIAIATLWDGVPDYACAVMHFCQHAQRLSDVFVKQLGAKSADLLVMLTNDHVYESTARCRCRRAKKKFCPECPGGVLARDGAAGGLEYARATLSADCPQMKVHMLDPRLREATWRYANKPGGGCRNKWQTTCLYKWWVVSLVEYSLVILADLDVQLLRPEQPLHLVTERWRRTWEHAVPRDGLPRVLAEGDHWTPFNGGLWTLGNPSRELYEDGLEQLRNGVWNATHGFNHAGTPEEHYARLPALNLRMRRTHMYRKNTWDFAFGDCDQGFLFHMFYLSNPREGLRRPGGDFEQTELKCLPNDPQSGTDVDARCPHTARHYWGPRKPWQLEIDNRGRVAHYLANTNFSGRSSVCAKRFTSWLGELPKVDASRPPSKFNGKVQRVR